MQSFSTYPEWQGRQSKDSVLNDIHFPLEQDFKNNTTPNNLIQ